MSDLTGEVLKSDVFALNAAPATPVANLFIQDPRLVLRSGCDSQVLIFVPFKQTVRLQGIVLDCGDAADAPTRARLYINVPSMGFSDCEAEPTQELLLTDADVRGGKELKLRLVRFNRVNSLHIFLGELSTDWAPEHARTAPRVGLVGLLCKLFCHGMLHACVHTVPPCAMHRVTEALPYTARCHVHFYDARPHHPTHTTQ